MHRFPLKSPVWLLPPLWPIGAVIVSFWLLAFCETWLVFHFIVTVTLFFTSSPRPDQVWILWAAAVLFLAHLAFYIWIRALLAHDRAEERRALEAQQHAAAMQQAQIDQQWQDYYRRLDAWNAWNIYQERVRRENDASPGTASRTT